MFCKNCGAEMDYKQAVCLKCGFKAGDGKKFCSNCGKEVNEGAAVCVSCGCTINGSSVHSTEKISGNAHKLEKKDKVLMAVLCFFFGAIGVHNFVMGETKKGIFKIVLTVCIGVGGGILALIDFIKILTNNYVVDPDKLI